MNKHLNIISYFGGKFPHLSWLIPLLPKGDYHFVDAMCGAANVALNVTYPLITINDLNDDVMNLYRVLREQPEEFKRAVYFTPFSRAELYRALTYRRRSDRVEWARNFYVRCQLGFGANGAQNRHKGAGMEYELQRSAFYRVDNWNVKLAKLDEIVSKLRHMQIESRDVMELIDRVDRPQTILYVDPPYLRSTRSDNKRYKHETDDAFHEKLLCTLGQVRHAYVALSGYHSDMYASVLGDWHITRGPETRSNVKKRKVRECLWTNYNPAVINGQMELF
jgi:DNA adenine methylase